MKSKVTRTKISQCRICKANDFAEVIKLEKMPFTDEFVKKEDTGSEYIQDIEIAVCKKCGSTQNIYDTDMSDYYNDYTYSVQSSGFAINFMKTLAGRIRENYFKNRENLKVIEIGSGTGEQLLEFKNAGCEVLGVEPSEELSEYANNIGVKTITAFFDKNIMKLISEDFKKADVVVTSYTFDHIPYPVEVLKVIHEILNDDGVLVIEVHDLELIRKRNEFCLFEHEHYTYLNDETMTALLNENRFEAETFDILNSEEKRANSLLVVAKKSNKNLPVKSDAAAQIKKLTDLNSNIQNSIKQIDNWLLENKDSLVVAYGAGGRGIMTIAALKNHDMIKYIVDKNPKSENILAPKSNIPVYGIDELGKNRADKILVFSFGYYDEIVKELGEKFGYRPEQFFSLLELLRT